VSASLSPCINIFGHLSDYGFTGPGDFVGMYQIAIDTQTMVSISTAGRSLSGNATFDSQLFSLKRKGGNRNHVRADALHGNNDAAVGNHGSRIGDELDSSTAGRDRVPSASTTSSCTRSTASFRRLAQLRCLVSQVW